jgi:hypothetical protein
MQDEEPDQRKQRLNAALKTLDPAELELWKAVLGFIEAQKAAGIPRDRALTMARNLLRTAANKRAARRRASLRVIKPE